MTIDLYQLTIRKPIEIKSHPSVAVYVNEIKLQLNIITTHLQSYTSGFLVIRGKRGGEVGGRARDRAEGRSPQPFPFETV